MNSSTRQNQFFDSGANTYYYLLWKEEIYLINCDLRRIIIITLKYDGELITIACPYTYKHGGSA